MFAGVTLHRKVGIELSNQWMFIGISFTGDRHVAISVNFSLTRWTPCFVNFQWDISVLAKNAYVRLKCMKLFINSRRTEGRDKATMSRLSRSRTLQGLDILIRRYVQASLDRIDLYWTTREILLQVPHRQPVLSKSKYPLEEKVVYCLGNESSEMITYSMMDCKMHW